jgi:hypothetical protein
MHAVSIFFPRKKSWISSANARQKQDAEQDAGMCPGMSSRQSNYECVQQVTQLHNLIAVKQAAVKTSNFPRSFLLDSNESLLKGSRDPPPHDLSLSLSRCSSRIIKRRRTSLHWVAVITAAFHYVFLTSCAHSHLIALPIIIHQLQKMWVELWLVIQWHLSLFHLQHVFPEFLTRVITYFQRTCSSPMESDCPWDKKSGSMSVAFA